MLKKRTVVAFILALIIGFQLPGGMGEVEAAAPFPDMPKQGVNEIERLYNDGILQGNPDGTLKPNAQVTRAEAVTLIGRALKLDGAKRKTKFTDVPEHHYASGYVATGVERGLISGTSATAFSPNQSVTRAQMAVFLQRAFNLNQTRPDVMYKDITSNTFGASAINAITTAQISSGYPDGSFGPNRGTTRLEFSLFLARAMYPEFKLSEYVPNDDVVAANSKKAVVYNAGDGLNVRQSPNTSQAPIGKLQNGDVIYYYATTGNWAIFKYEGKTAYVSLSYLQTDSPGGGTGGAAGPGLKGKTIVIDPGHGAHDPGTTGFGLKEKDVVLDIGLRVQKKLANEGVKVVMTRSNDTFLTLQERVAVAERNKANAFISIHANSATVSSANGSETFWNKQYAGPDSKKLAQAIQKELIDELNTRDRGVKEGNFYVIKNNKMASVLVEVGFLSNEAEAKKFADPVTREKAANAIVRGVKNFYK